MRALSHSRAEPLSFAYIEAYGWLHGVAMGRTTSANLAMDPAYIEAANSSKSGRPVRSAQPLTAEAFDAVFGG